jgi:hypothetical protein
MQAIYNLIKMTKRIQQCFDSNNKRRIATILNLQRKTNGQTDNRFAIAYGILIGGINSDDILFLTYIENVNFSSSSLEIF